MIAIRNVTERGALRTPSIRPSFHRNPLASGKLRYAPALSFPRHATAQQVIDALRMMCPGDESVCYLFVVGAEDQLVGVVSLRQVVIAAPDTRLDSVMSRDVISLPATLSPEEQAHILGASGLLALPVLDEAGRLIGSLNATALLGAVEQAATKAMYRLAGVAANEQLARSIARAARDRLLWLMISMAGALLAAAVVSRFQSVIAQVAMLVAFMPLVAGQGSKAGTQTLTFIVRSLALGEVSFQNGRRSLLRELCIGVCNGLTVGLLAGMIGWLWQGSVGLGVVLGVAMLGNLILASLVGVLAPLSLKALRIDPALASAIFVTTVTDVCGFALFLGLGALALSMGYL